MISIINVTLYIDTSPVSFAGHISVNRGALDSTNPRLRQAS
ncbi:hypothetical protein F383_13905 [Gossypium arboreum]|uniref:Uncharacterized protein n=1 Tax=Gossypium arboreum TaxID=29729 RepID=A0A0B0PZT7_GOSAR|nr:hypothetical protein F383_13905 [Gossypium arboreum]